MSQGFPCPNPTCPHVFPTAAVAGAAVLTCPRCATVFQFHSGAAAISARATSAPAARAAAPPAIPLAEPVTPRPAPDLMDFGDTGPNSPVALRQRVGRKARRPWRTALGAVVVLALAAVAATLGLNWRRLVPEKKAVKLTGDEVIYKGLNFRYLMPPRGWWSDDKTQKKLHNARLALHQTNPSAWFVVLARDYRTRNPRPRELTAEVLYALDQFFGTTLEYEHDDAATFQGQPAQRLRFRATLNNQTCSGECTMIAQQGFGYWLLSWAVGDSKRMEGEFEDLRRRFTVADERKGWEEKQPPLREFTAAKVGVRLIDREGVWEPAGGPATDHDPAAELVLHTRQQDLGADTETRRSPLIGATALVLVLPRADGDLKAAVDAARAHVLARQKTVYAETILEPISDKDRPPDEAVALGNARGHLGLLRIRNSDSVHRFAALAVVPRPALGHTLVLFGECFWKQRDSWEDVLLQLFTSLHVSDVPSQ